MIIMTASQPFANKAHNLITTRAGVNSKWHWNWKFNCYSSLELEMEMKKPHANWIGIGIEVLNWIKLINSISIPAIPNMPNVYRSSKNSLYSKTAGKSALHHCERPCKFFTYILLTQTYHYAFVYFTLSIFQECYFEDFATLCLCQKKQLVSDSLKIRKWTKA